ncbi:MAG: recombinase family protein [bacterium]|nr:recombinase family protein [bacterium]
MRAVAYARVSTRDQDLDLQIAEIKRFCDYRKTELMHVYAEKASGKNTDRPEFSRMIHDLEVGTYGAQAAIVYKLDRLGRSLSDLIRITEWLKDHSIDLISPSDSIDTTTPNGRLFFHISGAFAEYERERILERTAAGRQAAIEKGVQFGPKVKRIDRAKVERMIAQGIPKAEIARQLRIARNTLYQRLKEWEGEDAMKEDEERQKGWEQKQGETG